MDHGAIRLESVAESRAGGKALEEREERERGEREWIEVDEIYDVVGVDRWEEMLEGGVEGFRRSVLDGLGQGREDGVWFRRRVPGVAAVVES